MDGRAALVLCCLLVVVPPVTALDGASADQGRVTVPLSTPDGFDTTRFRIAVFENGSAEWTIEHARVLANESEREQFETFAATFNDRESDAFAAFRNRARALLAFGRNVTGREMRAVDFDRRASVNELGQTRGILELSFRWTAFARVNGTRVTVGDVFEGGMYIGEDQQLLLRRGPALGFLDVRPTPDSTSNPDSIRASETVTWTGERQFADQRPSAVLGPRAPAGGGDAGTGGDEAGADTSDGPDAAMLVGGVVVLLAVGAGVAWYGGYLPGRDGDVASRPDGASAENVGGPSAEPPESNAVAAVPEAELLSDEDRVRRLLEANGGRMRQVAIVDETDWSKSKVSMLLSEMEEAGEISKLRLGRENVISLAGEEPDAAGSPFEDEE